MAIRTIFVEFPGFIWGNGQGYLEATSWTVRGSQIEVDPQVRTDGGKSCLAFVESLPIKRFLGTIFLLISCTLLVYPLLEKDLGASLVKDDFEKHRTSRDRTLHRLVAPRASWS